MLRILRRVKRKIKEYLLNKINIYNIIQNINIDYTNKKQKKVLVVYLDTQYHYNENIIKHSNLYESTQIIKSLIDLNLCIDVINCEDYKSYQKIKDKKYDLIFGFGDIFYKMSNTNLDALKIIYLTESPPWFSRIRESERADYYYERHNSKVPLLRSGKYYKDEHFKYANYCVTLCEQELVNYDNVKTYRLLPTGLINNNYIFSDRNIKSSKKNFLWFGSRGAVHKGLDLLIDIFSKREDIILHICGLSKNDKKYIKIPKRKNIINHGFVDVKSSYFLDLVNECSFVILPSCSEASSTSIITCMNHSLIPIVQKDIGFNVFNHNIFILSDYKIEYINEKINQIINLDDEKIKEMHKNIYNISRVKFSMDCFHSNFKSIINNIFDDFYANR